MRVAVIVVTYNPNVPKFRTNLNSYINQAECVVVVDNSNLKSYIDEIGQLEFEYGNIKLIQFGENKGIAEAQNAGITYAMNNNYDFVLEMDQDSLLETNYILTLLASYKRLELKDFNVGTIGVVPVSEKTGLTYGGLKRNLGCYKVDKILSSGSVISCDVLRKVGLKDSKMFIDLVDWEWCWRARQFGFETYVDSALTIQHNLGEQHKNFLFLHIGVPVPIRHYYAFRNTLYLFSKSYVPLIWKVKSSFLLISKILIYPILLPQGALRLKFMIRGVIDFVNRNFGKYDG